MTSRLKWCCAAILGLLMLHGHAMTAPETLEEAWLQALARDHGLKAQQSQTGAAMNAVQAAQSLSWPKLAVGAARISGSEGAAVSLPGMVVPFTERSVTTWSVLATLPLYTGGRISNGVQAAQHGLLSSQAQEDVRRQALKFEVAAAFVNVLRAQRLLEVALKHQDVTEALVGDAQNLLAQGMVVKAHLLSAQVAHAGATQAVLQARMVLDLARADYNRLLDRDLDHEVQLAALAIPEVPAELGALTATAQTARAELRGLDEAAAGLMRQADVVQGEHMPQVALVGGRMGASHTILSRPAGHFVGVTVNWTLFDRGVVSRRAELHARADALREQRAQTMGLIALQVRQAWLRSEESRQRHGVALAAHGSAEESLRVARDRHVQGLATQTEVLAAESQRTQAEANLANAEFDRVMATQALHLALGTL